jgi:preprotein translocase subunit SecA
LSPEQLRQAEKRLMLQVLDTLWVRHLTALDALRQGIGLRAIGQQDPLVAYQKEAFEMYNQLKEEIKEEVVRRIYHPTIISETPRPKNIQAIHPSATAAGATPNTASQPPAPIRVEKMLGRNDLCHCGSGKKYKHCHMKLDLMAGNGAPAQQQVAATPEKTTAGPRRGHKKQAQQRRR